MNSKYQRAALDQPDQTLAEQTLALLTDPAIDEDERTAAAADLLDLREVTPEQIRSAADMPDALEAMINSAADDPERSLRLLDTLDPDTLGVDHACALLRTAARDRSKHAAATLIAWLAPTTTRQAAADSLIHLCGRSDLDSSQEQWRAWWRSLSDLDDLAWLNTVTSDLVDRALKLETRAQRAERALADTYRRLYLVTDASNRPALLVELLQSDQPGLRALGFELADRELASNSGLDPTVAQLAIKLLEHADPSVRASAARLVNRLAPPDAAEPITRALAYETDAAAAEPLLLAAVRWPSPQDVEPVLHWLTVASTRDAASQAGVAMFDSGLFAADEVRERVRALLTPLPPDPTPSTLQLLALVGTDADLEAIARHLQDQTQGGRQAAADALARTPRGCTVLISRASDIPNAGPIALIALARHNHLEQADQTFDDAATWTQAFDLASAPAVKAALAKRALQRFSTELSDEQKTTLQAAVGTP